jgi:MFS family permease
VAVVGFGILNGPIWGLMGAFANHRLTSELGIVAVSLGLVAASLAGAFGNSISAALLESTGSMRGPVTALAAITAIAAIFLIHRMRRTDRRSYSAS